MMRAKAPICAFAGLIGQDEVRMPMALKPGAKIIVIAVSVGAFLLGFGSFCAMAHGGNYCAYDADISSSEEARC